MAPEVFGKAIREIRQRVPFRPVRAEFADGTWVVIDRPDNLAVSGNRAVFVDPRGDVFSLDPGSVAALFDVGPEAPPDKCGNGP